MHGRPLRREFVCIDCGPPSALGIETINTPLLNSLYIPFKSDSRVPALKIQFKRARINAGRETTRVRKRYSQISSGTVCRSRNDSAEKKVYDFLDKNLSMNDGRNFFFVGELLSFQSYQNVDTKREMIEGEKERLEE